MTVDALAAARALWEAKNRDVSNLELQKLLYIAHMIHLGRHGRPLVYEDFEAWDYGPVVPSVYRHVRGFGSGPVRNVFHWIPNVEPGSTEDAAIDEAVQLTRGMTAGRLVSITHWPEGAWSKIYKPGRTGLVIPNRLIADEYARRQQAPA